MRLVVVLLLLSLILFDSWCPAPPPERMSLIKNDFILAYSSSYRPPVQSVAAKSDVILVSVENQIDILF